MVLQVGGAERGMLVKYFLAGTAALVTVNPKGRATLLVGRNSAVSKVA